MTDLVQEREGQKRPESRLSADFLMPDSSLPRGISDGLEYDEQRATLTNNSRSRNATQLAKKALELYYNSDPTNQPITFSPEVTWDDVFSAAKEARALDNQNSRETVMQKAKVSYNSKERLRKLGRSIEDVAPAIVHELDFAPDEMYIGVVCQGLKFVFDVAIRLAEKRRKILEVFEDIPELVQEVQTYHNYFDEDLDYVVLREEFDACLLTSIAKSIQWLERGAIWKSIEALIQGPLAAQSVDDLMDDVQVKRDNLRSRIHILNTRKQFFNSKDAESSVHKEDALLAGQAKIKDQVDNTAHVKNFVYDIDVMANKVQEIRAMMQSRETIQAKARKDEARKDEARKDAMKRDVCNRFLALLSENFKKREQPTLTSQRQNQVTKSPKSKVTLPVLSQAGLRSFMAVDNNHLSDISRILQNSARFDGQELRLACAIAKSTDVKTWLNATRGILFLNGSGDTTAARESPISASLASLAVAISGDPNSIVLHFFCGLHSESFEAISGPNGLMRSLIAQLSLKFDFNIAFVDKEAQRIAIRDHDLRTLCETFSAMACQLPADYELCCIIDGISWLETPRWREDLAAAFAYLCYLSVDPHCQAHFRLMVSSPVRSLMLTNELRQYGELADVVEVHSIRVTERDMPTERELREIFSWIPTYPVAVSSDLPEDAESIISLEKKIEANKDIDPIDEETGSMSSDSSSEYQESRPTDFPVSDTAPSSFEVDAHMEKQRSLEIPTYTVSSDRPEDDVESIASLDDDIRSLAESNAPYEPQKLACECLIDALSKDTEVLASYNQSCKGKQAITHQRFVRNHVKLLKAFFLGVSHEAEDALFKEAARFLRSRNRRYQISAIIYQKSASTTTLELDREAHKGGMHKVEDYLSKYTPEEVEPVHQDLDAVDGNSKADLNSEDDDNDSDADVDADADADDDDDDDDDDDAAAADADADAVYPILEAAVTFLTSSRAFVAYKLRLRRFAGGLPQPEVAFQRALDDGALEEATSLLELEGLAILSCRGYQCLGRLLDSGFDARDVVAHAIESRSWEAANDDWRNLWARVRTRLLAHADNEPKLKEKSSDTRREAGYLNFNKFTDFRICFRSSYLGRKVARILRPAIPKGYTRVEWTCDCGKTLFDDFLCDTPSSLQAVQDMLARVSATPTGTTGDVGGLAANQVPGAQHHVGNNSLSSSGDAALSSISVPNDTNQPLRTGNPSFNGNLTNNASSHQRLYICAKSGDLTLSVREIDASSMRNDFQLFSRIREEYTAIRSCQGILRTGHSKDWTTVPSMGH
ncbi:hypothetical protein KCU93_g3194, partial [Aureobasidium melanogenum]